MDVQLLDEEWGLLTDFFPVDWREQARSCGALRRARGVADADCLLRLILLHTATGLSLRQTVVRARVQELADISDVALSEAMSAWVLPRLYGRPSGIGTSPRIAFLAVGEEAGLGESFQNVGR